MTSTPASDPAGLRDADGLGDPDGFSSADPDPGPEAPQETAAALARTLRGAMHVAFAVLPAVGAVRAHDADAVPLPLALATAAAVVGIYLIGSWFALRRGEAGRSARTDLLLPSRGWVLALALVWMASTFVSAAFVWIAFPLFFLVLFALGRVAGPLVLGAVALWAVLAPLLAREQWGSSQLRG